MICTIFIAFLTPLLSHADLLDFSDSSLWDASFGNAAWKAESSKWTPALKTTGTNTALDFGSGKDGVFSNGPAQTGLFLDSGQWVFDTDVKSDFQFSHFELNSASVRIVGSKPLVLRVLGDVTIGSGSNMAADGGGGSEPSGGAGARSGGQGGLQASATVSEAGSDGIEAGSGGSGGSSDTSAGGSNGGGGGCLVSGSATAGTGGGSGSAGVCSVAAATLASSLTSPGSTDTGGAGGGGGYLKDLISPYLYDGAGGGGAARNISILALGHVSIEGTLSAQGGEGGDNATNGGIPNCAGAGGGGSGGILWILSGESIDGSGVLNVAGGSGGGTVSCGGIYAGGDGSRGVIRLDADTVSFSGTFSPSGSTDHSETFTYQLGPHELRTHWIQYNDGYMDFSSPSITLEGSSGDGAVQVFVENNKGESVPFEDISELSGSKQIRFRAVWENVTGNDPERVTGLSYDAQLAEIRTFPLNGNWGCAALGAPMSATEGVAQAAVNGLFALFLLSFRRRRKRSSSRLK